MRGTSGKMFGVIAVFLGLIVSLPARADMGRTAGSWGVSPSGAANYSIPIWVQPGPKNMQPSLAFTYNSQGGNGTMGVGWGLSGFSSIDRCPWTEAEDGKAISVNVSATDRFCLDGNKLRITSGPLANYGATGAVYQTEIANFSRVTSVGTAGSGPQSFLVHTKAGLILEYGSTEDSRVLLGLSTTVYRWLLNKVSDREGNSYVITYTTDNSVGRVPLKVNWAKTSSGIYQYEAYFSYTNKSDPRDIVTMRQGSDTITTKLILNSVAIGYSASGSSYSPKRQYILNYLPSPVTGQSRLTEIKECATSISVCLKPSSISYQNGLAGVSSSATTTGVPAGAPGKYDFDGDGRTDFAYFSGTWKVAFSTGAGFTAAVDTGISGTAKVGRFVASHKDGLLVDVGGTWSYVGYNAGSFTTTSTGVPVTSDTLLTDYNGDGIQDLVWSSITSSGGAWTGFANLRLNTTAGAATAPSFSTTVYQPFVMSLGNFGGNFVIVPANNCPTTRLCDINGDGAEDLTAVVISTSHCTGGMGGCSPIETGYDLVTGGFGYYLANGNPGFAQPYLGIRFNDDRCIDSMRPAAATMRVHGCGSGAATTVVLPATPIAVLDWDGDRRTDLVVNNGGVLGIYKSNGTTTSPFSSLITTSIPYNSGCSYFAADIEGDGLDELVCVSGSGVIYYSHNGNGSVGSGGGTATFATQIPDLVSSITDGYGLTVSPFYVHTAQSNYTKGEGTALPLLDDTNGKTVVGRIRVSDGIGTTYDLDYTYKGARVHGKLNSASAPGTPESGNGAPKVLYGPEGRSVGFEEITVVDSRNGLKQKTTYEQSFPLTGMVAKAETFQPNATPISIADPVNLVEPLGTEANNQRYFPYVSEITSDTYEVGGSLDGDLITHVVRTFEYASFEHGNIETDTTVVTDEDPTDPAYEDKTWTTTITNSYDSALTSGTDWCIGFVTQIEAEQSSALPGVDGVTRTIGFTRDSADPSKCRTKTKTIEPTPSPASDQYRVAETYEFDSFGNISSVQVVGRKPSGGSFVDMAARTTSIDWGTTGQFPATVTDPSGAATTFTYNHDLGTLQEAFDPNSTESNIIKTSFLYDNFARKTRETRPDATYTTWNYGDCTGACVYPTHKLTVTTSDFDNADHPIASRVVYYDAFEQPFVTRTPLLAGEQWSETQYDALGRVYKQYMPCTTISASNSCRTNAVTNSYDLLNRLTQSSRPQTQALPTPQTTTYSYAGRTQTITDALNQVTTRVTNVDSTVRGIKDANNHVVSFAYDAAGSLKSVTDSASSSPRLSAVTVHYGIQPFQVAATDSALGAFTRTYNSLGELVGWTDAKNQSFTATYDNLSRPLTRDEPGMSTTWEWGAVATQFNKGRLKRVFSVANSETYEENFTYDDRTRLVTQAITIPGQGTFNYDYSYEPNKGWLDTLTYPVSTASYRLALKYAYQNGSLHSVADANVPSTVFWTADSTNAWGQTTQETLGNNVITTRAFDAVNARLSSIHSGPSGNPTSIQNLSYVYDLVGNVIQRQNSTLAENFYYGGSGSSDKLYRLEHSTVSNGATATNLGLTYDTSGNILTKEQPQLEPLIAQSISWTSYNYPAQITAGNQTASFSYGPDRQRWKMVFSGSGTETTYTIGGLLEKVEVGGVATFRHTIVGGNRAVAIYSRPSSGSPVLRYVLGDHQGSTESFVENGTGTVTKSSFSAFGMRRDAATWSGEPTNRTALDEITRQGYTYQTVLGSMGLNHMNGRVQDAVSGRFLSADPYITEPSYTQSFNRYSYVYNNPATFSDPSGFGPCYSVSINILPGPTSATAPQLGDIQTIIVSGFNQPTYTYCPPTPTGPQTAPTDGGNPNPGGGEPQLPEIVVTGTKPQGECWRPFTAEGSFSSEYLSRLGNLGAGILDSVSGSIDLGMQIKGKVNVGPLLNVDATYGVINFSAGTSAAGNIDLNVRLPEQGSWVFGEVSAGAGNAKFGAARNSVVDGISVRRGPYEDYAEGFFFTPKYKTHDPHWGKFGAHLQLGLGAKLEVDVRKIGTAVSCAFD